MMFKPTTTEGRVAEGKTPYGDYRVEWDADGNLISESCEIKHPAPATDSDIRQAIQRADICRSCEHAKKVALTVNTRPVYGVKCGKCGCGNLSLIGGKCPLNKWNQADAT